MREWLAMTIKSVGGSDIVSKRAGGVWASSYKQVYVWALG